MSQSEPGTVFKSSVPGPSQVVGRLAPSPTGPLHLGHARSFLLAWWQARQAGGRIVLRQEDLDAQRCSLAFRDLVRTDLEWLGIDWDGSECIQSERLEVYAHAAQKLYSQRLAYPCVCSRSDIQSAVSAPHTEEVHAIYPGTCRDRFSSLQHAEASTGKPAGLRALVPERCIEFTDGLAGRVGQNLAQEVGDFIILRRDGVPSYQLAVVIDDAAQGITSVVRGADLLDSTPRQLFLATALGLPIPNYYHVPLVVDDSGQRLAKRNQSLSLQELRQRGVDPRRVVQWAAQCSGLSAPEPAFPSAFVSSFELTRVPRHPVAAPVY